MHYASVKWICFLLFVVVGKVAMAEGITSPDGNLRLEFTVNALGEPVYQLFFDEKSEIFRNSCIMATHRLNSAN